MRERLPRAAAAFSLSGGGARGRPDTGRCGPQPAAAARFERVTFEQAVTPRHRAPPDGRRGGSGDPARAGAARPVEVRVPPLALRGVNGVMLDAARGFNGFETVPRSADGLQRDARLPDPRHRGLGCQEPGRGPGGDLADLRGGDAPAGGDHRRRDVPRRDRRAAPARDRASQPGHAPARSSSTRRPGSTPARAAGSTTCARPRSAARPSCSSSSRSCSCARRRRRSASPSSPTLRSTRTATPS